MPRALRAAAVLIVGSSIWVPSTGLAAKVLVLPYQCLGKGVPTDLAEQATVVITKEMAQGGLTVIQADDVAEAESSKPPPPGSRRGADAPTGDPNAGHKAEELIARAKEAVEDSEFSTAIKELKNAVRLLEENGDAVSDLRLLPEAYLQLGIAYFRDGSEDEGDDMLSKAVHLDPERTIDSTDYPPLFVSVFDRARFNVLRRPRAMIEVKAARGASVLFDGRNMGKAPLLLKEALPGNHWIRVERPGEAVQVKKISVRAQRTILVEFEGAAESEKNDSGPPVGVLGAIVANDLSRAHIAQLKAAGARAGADFVMLGAIYKTDTAYMIRTAYVGVKDGSFGRLVDIAFDLDMLSAEIEVYKLAEDARNQASSGNLTNIVNDERIAIAPGLKKATDRKPTGKPVEDVKVANVLAAPPAPPPPQVAVIPDPSVDAKVKVGGRAPMTGNGHADGAVDDKGAVATKVSIPATALVPKDEVTPKSSLTATGPVSSTGRSDVARGTLIPDDERTNEPSTWWIWAIVGVAAAGAVGAGGYFIISSQSPDEGNLRVTWGQ